MRKYLAFLLLVPTLSADIVWLADPSSPPVNPPAFTEDPNGISSTASATGWYSPALEIYYFAWRPFEITTAGWFDVTTAVTLTGNGEYCGETWGGCDGALDMSYTGFSFGQSFSGDGERLGSYAPLVLTGGADQIVYLAAGDYSLTQEIDAFVNSYDGPTLDVSMQTDIVAVEPVPEPRTILVLCLFLAGALLWGFLRSLAQYIRAVRRIRKRNGQSPSAEIGA